MEILIIGLIALAISGTAFAANSTSSSTGSLKIDEVWNKYDSYFKKYSAMYNIPFKYLKGIALNESSLGTHPLVQAGLASEDGLSYGIMQMQLSTARDYLSLATIKDLNNPDTSIFLAAQHLNKLSLIFNGNEEDIIKAYNQGQGKRIKVKKGIASDSQITLNYWSRYLRWVEKMKVRGEA